MLPVNLLTSEDLGPILAELQAIRAHQAAAAQPADDYLSVEQVALITHTSTRTVRKWISAGKADQRGRIVRLFTLEFSPGYPRIPRSALLAFGQAQGFEASQLPLPASGLPPVAPKPKRVLDSAAALRKTA